MPMLQDRWGRVADDLRLSLIDKCNLRCTYCMPAEGLDWLKRAELLTAEEAVRIADIGVRLLGVREVRFTGGEPLVRADLPEIIGGIRERHPHVPLSITTNGIGLEKKVDRLIAAGLDRINVSLDTVCAPTFARITRRDRLPHVLRGLEAAAAAGLSPIKINAVLMRGINDDGAAELLEWSLAHGFQLRFIEQMPLDADHGWTRENMITAQEIRENLERSFSLLPHGAPRGSSPARLWEVARRGGTQVLGTVGIIASVTEPFCAACTRTRITADGKIRSCLFSHEETDLMSALRDGSTDAQVARLWQETMWAKPKAHGRDRVGLGVPGFVQPDRSMSAIGG
ncbi:cyclic pyranopterin phosphate synthase [Rothia kristinae]|uniref:GTP 3',8-cyclase n=1 Tax=Rothia kristinae TaxID=37923 RepID=A0A1S2MYL4_9MICC|nr:GTP 3',8-cyclase MoaA [Rothia kristinae]OIJ35399.1 cyclic pyranopterin phosphate synthase [Rothia kristinae]